MITIVSLVTIYPHTMLLYWIVLLTIFLMLYSTSLKFIYFITGGLCFLIPFTYFPYFPNPSFWQPEIFSLYLWVYILFCLFDAHIREIMWYLPLSDIWLSVITSRSIHIVTKGKTSFFLMANEIPLCIYATSSLSIHPPMNTLVAFICLALRNNATVMGCILSFQRVLSFFWVNTCKWDCWIIW